MANADILLQLHRYQCLMHRWITLRLSIIGLSVGSEVFLLANNSRQRECLIRQISPSSLQSVANGKLL